MFAQWRHGLCCVSQNCPIIKLCLTVIGKMWAYIKHWKSEFCLPYLLVGRDWALHTFFKSLSFLPQSPCDVFAQLATRIPVMALLWISPQSLVNHLGWIPHFMFNSFRLKRKEWTEFLPAFLCYLISTISNGFMNPISWMRRLSLKIMKWILALGYIATKTSWLKI